jgi:hypothetical protein
MSTPPKGHVYWQCQRCTNCCRWVGDVKVSAAEITAIAGYLGMEEQAFVDGYTRLRADRLGLSIIDREDHSCIFLEGGGCVINAVKFSGVEAGMRGGAGDGGGWGAVCGRAPGGRGCG